MNYFLAVSLMSADQHISLSTISDLCFKQGCHVTQAKITLLGHIYAVHFLAQGLWHQISLLEQKLQRLEKKLKFQSLQTRTFEIWHHAETGTCLGYTLHVISAHQPSTLNQLLSFIESQGLCLEDTILNTHPNHFGTRMLYISCKIMLKGNQSINQLRESAAVFSEKNNLDLFIEPTRT